MYKFTDDWTEHWICPYLDVFKAAFLPFKRQRFAFHSTFIRHLHFFDHLSNHFILTRKSSELSKTKGSFCCRRNIFRSLVITIFSDFLRFHQTFLVFQAVLVKMRQKQICTKAQIFWWFERIFLIFFVLKINRGQNYAGA